MNRIVELLREHAANDVTIAGIDGKIACLAAEIARKLAPALKRSGTVEFWDGARKCAVRLTEGGAVSIEPLAPQHVLSLPTRPRRFTDAEIVEAAMYAVFSDDDDDDTCEIISLPGRRVVLTGGNAG
jgi:hypothetical protein